MNKLIFIVLFSLFFINNSFADNVGDSSLLKSSLILIGSNYFDVSIELTNIPENFIYGKSYIWGGDENSPPKKIIKNIKVIINKEDIFIPLSAYSDLGAPRDIFLKKLALNKFELSIRGGDAGGSYKAVFVFINTKFLAGMKFLAEQ